MTIHYYRESVYGVNHLYVRDSKVADTIQSLTGKKTIDISDIKAFNELGFKFVECLQPIS